MKEIIGTKSDSLQGKFIVIGVCGSVAAVRAFELCRELIRHGARVQFAASRAALEFVGETLLEFGSGRKVIKNLTGKNEHVKLFSKKGKADMLLVAPCTANTISKIAMGIDDTPITTMATIAIGAGKPVLIAPAMHEPMYGHPIVKENLQKLEKMGCIKIIFPLMEEEKAKLAELEEIVLEVEKAFTKQSLQGKKVLVAGGSCREEIDSTKYLTTKSSGKTAKELCLEAFRRGAEVTLIHNGRLYLPRQIRHESAYSFEDFYKTVFAELGKGFDFFLSPAALSDFSVKRKAKKIKSGHAFSLELFPNKKLGKEVRKKFPELSMVAFKSETKMPEKELEKTAKKFLQENKLQAVVANNVESIDKNETKALIVTSKKTLRFAGKKSSLAKKVFELL